MIGIFSVINISELSTEELSLRYSFPDMDQGLLKSIAEFGILSPLLVRKLNDKYEVLSGFRRVHIAEKLNLTDIPVLICDIDNISALRCSLSENTSQRALNIFEKATVIDILLNRLSIAEQAVIKEYLPLLGLNPHKSILERILSVNDLSAQQKTDLYNAGIEEDKILSLRLLEPDTKNTFISLLIQLKPGVNKFNQIIELITEISRREKKNIRTVCDELNFDNLIHSEEHPASQRLNMLRTALQHRRNPAISKTEDFLSSKTNELKIPHGVRVSTPNLCENNSINIDLSIKSPESLKQMAKKLTDISESPALHDIFKCLKGEIS